MTTEHTLVRSGKLKRKPFNSNVAGRPLANYRDLWLQLPSRIERHANHSRGVSLRFWISRDSANDLLTGALSWFEFIEFRRDIVVSSLFSRHQFLQKAAPKITLRCFHQADHQIFWYSVESSVLIDFGVDRISEAICRDAVDENANHPAV